MKQTFALYADWRWLSHLCKQLALQTFFCEHFLHKTAELIRVLSLMYLFCSRARYILKIGIFLAFFKLTALTHRGLAHTYFYEFQAAEVGQ